MVSVHFQGKPFKITVIHVYAPTTNAEEAEAEQFYEDLQDPLELKLKKKCHFHYGQWECKRRKSTATWSNRQIQPRGTKQSRSKTNRVLPREHAGHSKHPIPTTQDFTHGHHQVVNAAIRLITFFAAKDGEALYNQQKQDKELTVSQIMNLLIAKFRLKSKRVGKTTRSSRGLVT